MVFLIRAQLNIELQVCIDRMLAGMDRSTSERLFCCVCCWNDDSNDRPDTADVSIVTPKYLDLLFYVIFP